MLAEPLVVTLLVIEAFEKLNIPYLIGGSLASALHGTARSTLDTDLVADMRPEQVDPLVEMLQKVDVFIAKPRRFDQMQLRRRRLEVVSTEPERRAYVATAEDIVLAKLEWYRQGGEVSDRQWRDILGVLKVQAGRLDSDYLQKWAAELNVADLLQRALKESK